MGNGENEADEMEAPGMARARFKTRVLGPAPCRKVPTTTGARMYSRPLSIMATAAGPEALKSTTTRPQNVLVTRRRT
jgi:hypothetical protein